MRPGADRLAFDPADTVASILKKQTGQKVKLRMKSGEKLGGKIEVDSELNRGTKVTILLPLFELQNESDLHMLEPQ